jgi:hypothetical protein
VDPARVASVTRLQTILIGFRKLTGMILLFVEKYQDLEHSPICGQNQGITGDQLDRDAKSSKSRTLCRVLWRAEAELLWTWRRQKKRGRPGLTRFALPYSIWSEIVEASQIR